MRFTVDTQEELNTPRVISAQADTGVLEPGKPVNVTIECNAATFHLDVYKLDEAGNILENGYTTLNDALMDEHDNRHFSYQTTFTDNGRYGLRFVALGEQLNWSDDAADQAYIDLIVCNHEVQETYVKSLPPVRADKDTHILPRVYHLACLCGAVDQGDITKEERVPHDPQTGKKLYIKPEHENDSGHRRYYICSCGEQILLAGYVNDTVNCSICKAASDRIKEAQRLLNALGYDAGTEDGILGSKTADALKAFQKDVGLPASGKLDDATWQALHDRFSQVEQPTPEPTEEPPEELENEVPETLDDIYVEYVTSLIEDEDMREEFNSWRNVPYNYQNNGYLLLEFIYDMSNDNKIGADSLIWKWKDALWGIKDIKLDLDTFIGWILDGLDPNGYNLGDLMIDVLQENDDIVSKYNGHIEQINSIVGKTNDVIESFYIPDNNDIGVSNDPNSVGK